MPQRHSKNSNDLGHFTYEERRKLGFGTQRERLGKDSLKPFDSCSLCLKPLVEPLSCKKGHLFCKECIYSSIMAQKKDAKRKLAIFEAQEQQRKEELVEQAEEEKERQLEIFDKQNNSAIPNIQQKDTQQRSSNASFHGANSVKTTLFEEEALRTMKAYWLPSATPDAPVQVEAPNTNTLCPEGNEKLKIKDLFPIIFTDIPRRERKEIEIGGERFMCPSCSTTLTNVTKLSAVSTCGHVFCKKCAEKFVLADKVCVTCNKPCKTKEVVQLQQGGTGFAAHGDNVVATAYKHLGSGSGAAVLRPATRV